MIIKETSCLCLETTDQANKYEISFKSCFPEPNLITIAEVCYDAGISDYYIKMLSDRFQTFICDYDRFKELIMLIDEAYDRLTTQV